MKPLKLVMSAFGPYKDKKEVDFSKLGNNGIFLVTGDTGAGKTTIFDGISFALFGESSGSHRETTSFRSKFADVDVETYVELTFSHRNKEYVIHRNPSYLVPKKRGSGETTKPSDATLTYDDKIVTGLKVVNEKILEILGINSKQFKQISMLAQGEFLKILHADSDERKLIFRKIFDTDLFDLITTKLNEKYKNNKDEIENLKTEFVTNANNRILKEGSTFVDKNTLTKENINKILEELESEVASNNKDNEEIEVKFKQKDEEYKKLENNIKTIEENNTRLTSFNKLKEDENSLKNKENDINKDRENIERNNQILRVIKPIEFNIEKITKDIKDTEHKVKEKQGIIQKNEEAEKLIGEKEEKIKSLRPLIEEYNNIKTTIKENTEIFNNIQEVLKYYKEKHLLDDEYIKRHEEYIKLDLEYKEEDDKYFRNQAGILANKLENDKPCPVCGSLEHPHIATVEVNVLTKDELDLKKKKLEEKQRKVNEIKEKISSINSKIEIINKKINCIDEEGVKILEESIKTKNDESNKTLKEIVDNFDNIYNMITSSKTDIDSFVLVDFIDKFNKDNNKIKDELQSSRKLLEEYNNTLVNLEKNLKDENNKLNSAIIELGFKDREEYFSNVLTEKNIKELEDRVRNYERDMTTTKTKLIEIEKLLVNKEFIDLTEEKAKLDNLKEELYSINKEKQKYFSVFDNNMKIKEKLNSTSKKLINYMDNFSVYEELYKLSSGTISGKRRISFEQYVQATYFDNVLYEANLRLQNMTDGRFKLLRKETADSLSAKFALDLDVYDEYNGSRRDVKSLSGGESFKAALSLALGLSDVIQNYSGSIVIDTLFIDEGFGSLDQDSREQAINTLNLISNNDKLIGIISHVSELKDRIDKKIIVSKTKEGSEIKIEV